MSFLSPSDVLMVQRAITASLPDTATNSRTGETHPCRIAPQTRMERLPQLPHYLRLPTFRLTQSDGVALHSGDSLTIADGTTLASKGTYTVLEVFLPQSYSVSTDASLLLVRRADGTVALLNTASVQFRQRSIGTGTQPVTIGPFGVMVDYLDPEAVPAGTEFSFRIAMTWDDAIVFPDGQRPSEGDSVLWTGVANGRAALRFPRPLVVLPALTAYLDGTPA